MPETRFFSGVNLYLALSGLLSGAMIFAPLAYASNFAIGHHASIYGGFVVLEQNLGHGMINAQTLELFQLPFHIPYVLCAVLALLACLGICFYNSDGAKKRLWVGRALILAFVHFLLGALLRFLGSVHVDAGHAGAEVVSGFQREYLLHLFILYFLWRAWRKLANA